ncbi:O-methyltransferase, partial [Lutimonas sp.]|uniref:O-methyltransferase n=1 Tax=Lutimonas sp. TaxID=1872403 RepID=UPI003D9B90D7
YIGSLLKTLIASKPNSNLLELGTGIGLTLSWMIEAMTENSKLFSVDNDPELIQIADSFFGKDRRVSLVCDDGSQWIKDYKGDKFDLIFADAWPGKYSDLEETLDLLKTGGFYVIDDMLPQPNWPDGHQELASDLIHILENRDDLQLTKINWSTGIIIASKIG